MGVLEKITLNSGISDGYVGVGARLMEVLQFYYMRNKVMVVKRLLTIRLEKL